MADEKKQKVDYLRLSTNILDFASNLHRGSMAYGAGKFAAGQHQTNARRALQSGQQTASAIRTRGRETAGAAKAAMIAQGGTVDSEMLARIKTEADIDAIGAMYDAKADALTHELAGDAERMRGRHTYRSSLLSAGSNILSATAQFRKN